MLTTYTFVPATVLLSDSSFCLPPSPLPVQFCLPLFFISACCYPDCLPSSACCHPPFLFVISACRYPHCLPLSSVPVLHFCLPPSSLPAQLCMPPSSLHVLESACRHTLCLFRQFCPSPIPAITNLI
jgi:hypothetical protein